MSWMLTDFISGQNKKAFHGHCTSTSHLWNAQSLNPRPTTKGSKVTAPAHQHGRDVPKGSVSSEGNETVECSLDFE